MRKGRLRIIQEIRYSKKQCGIASMVFAPLPKDLEKIMERYLQERFDFWWDSWIEPKLAELEAKEGRK